MTPQDLTKRLASGQIDPLYVLVGPETWLTDELLAALRNRLASADDLMNSHIFMGSEAAPDELVAMAQTLPAFADRRFIVVRDAERLASSDALRAYCNDPAPTTSIVFITTKFDRRKSWVANLLKAAVTVACDPLRPAALRTWVQRTASSHGIRLSDDAIAYLIERSDGSVHAVASELDKLALSRGDTGTGIVTANDLTSSIPGSPAVSVFDWAHAVAMGDARAASTSLQRLLQDEVPLVLLSVLTGQWRTMLRLRTVVDEGVAVATALQSLAIHPAAARRVTEAVKRHSALELLCGLTWCLETDATIKGGSLSPALALARLVSALCGGAAAGRPNSRSVTARWWDGLSARRDAVGVTRQARNQP